MQSNKLIAEFMGLSIKEGVSYYTDQDDMFFMGIEVEEPYLPFDEDWNWLITVVDKIETELEEEFRVVILEHECSIHQKTEDQKLQIAFQCVAERFGISKIQATYEAVVEFIKQYNDGE